VFAANNVIDLVCKASDIFMYQAVFTTSLRTLDHQTPRGVVYVTSHWLVSGGRALWPCGGYVPDP